MLPKQRVNELLTIVVDAIRRIPGAYTTAHKLPSVRAFARGDRRNSLPHPVARMGRCHYRLCQTAATFNFEGGSKTGVYCKLHAEDGMVMVALKRCTHESCMKHPNFNVAGSKQAMYCRQHAKADMVDVRSKRCLHGSCRKRPTFNVGGTRTVVYCKQHAEDGMIDVSSKRCFHGPCTKQPSFNVVDSKVAVYCKQHALDGMVNVRHARCSHDSSTRQRMFSWEESKIPLHSEKHAEDGIFNVPVRRSSREFVTTPGAGVPTDVKATTCGMNRNHILRCSADTSESVYDVLKLPKRSRLDLNGKQRYDCPDRCQQHRTTATHIIDGGGSGMCCKQHAADGMGNVLLKRCSHDTCMKLPSFNAEGSKQTIYCRRHATTDMVDVRSKRCLHDTCQRRPTFNVEGSKTVVYCKLHAEDGMVDVSSKRCLYGPCTKQPSFNVSGSKTAAYCLQHAADGMVNVRYKRCSRDSKANQRSISVEDTKTPVHCHQRLEDGVANVPTKPFSIGYFKTGPVRDISSVEAAPCTVRKRHVLDGSLDMFGSSSEVMECRKRSRLKFFRKQTPPSLDHSPFEEVRRVAALGTCPTNKIPLPSSFSGVRKSNDDETLKISSKLTRPSKPRTVSLLADAHQTGQHIKTEAGFAL